MITSDYYIFGTLFLIIALLAIHNMFEDDDQKHVQVDRKREIKELVYIDLETDELYVTTKSPVEIHFAYPDKKYDYLGEL